MPVSSNVRQMQNTRARKPCRQCHTVLLHVVGDSQSVATLRQGFNAPGVAAPNEASPTPDTPHEASSAAHWLGPSQVGRPSFTLKLGVARFGSPCRLPASHSQTRASCCCTFALAATTHLRFVCFQYMPNPALELTRYGRRPCLGGIRFAHCVPPSQVRLP